MTTALGTRYCLFESVEAIPAEQTAAENTNRRFSDYVVYVDESGDHSLASIDQDYPVFVLALCVFHKRHFSVVLHENEIRKQKGIFAFLSHRPTRSEFMDSTVRPYLRKATHR